MSEEEQKTESAGTEQEIIVVAEDSAPNRAILVHLLKKLGYHVEECNDGQIAWDKTQELYAAKTPPVAILSDIMMPNMDGINFLKNVRGNDEMKDIPFVLVTAVSDKEHVMQAKEFEVNGYIVKPVSFQRVLGKLQELFPAKTFPAIAS